MAFFQISVDGAKTERGKGSPQRSQLPKTSKREKIVSGESRASLACSESLRHGRRAAHGVQRESWLIFNVAPSLHV